MSQCTMELVTSHVDFSKQCDSSVPTCKDTSMGESNTVVSAYTLYRHLQQYWSHPWTYFGLPGIDTIRI